MRMIRYGRWLMVVCTLVTTRAGAAQSKPKSEMVAYPSGDEKASGFLALPTTAGKHPAMIVIHEWWGLNDWVKAKANSFADQGYAALAVDLYRGKSTADSDIAHQLMRGLPEDRALRDMEAAFNYLASRPDVDPGRIGVVGWCMGGGYALALAVAEPRLRAGAIYYGRLVTDPASIARIKASLIGSFGADDQGITPESLKVFEGAAKKANVSVSFKVYPNSGHGFASSRDPKVFKAEAARDADARTDQFFGQQLKKR